MNIFERLTVPHAVGVAVESFIAKGTDATGLDYHIIVAAADRSAVTGLGFKSEDGQPTVLTRSLIHSEIQVFKASLDKYDKILHNSNGRVYELKGDSFKSHLKLILKKKKKK